MRPIGLYFSELPTNEASRSKDAMYVHTSGLNVAIGVSIGPEVFI